jgi:hypothetical protein
VFVLREGKLGGVAAALAAPALPTARLRSKRMVQKSCLKIVSGQSWQTSGLFRHAAFFVPRFTFKSTSIVWTI